MTPLQRTINTQDSAQYLGSSTPISTPNATEQARLGSRGRLVSRLGYWSLQSATQGLRNRGHIVTTMSDSDSDTNRTRHSCYSTLLVLSGPILLIP